MTLTPLQVKACPRMSNCPENRSCPWYGHPARKEDTLCHVTDGFYFMPYIYRVH
uniref:Uncharacterized protein n=1 Tax=viral metagenome TaxID=1070528 RepID=A0A6H1ZNK1_9ZZZZ